MIGARVTPAQLSVCLRFGRGAASRATRLKVGIARSVEKAAFAQKWCDEAFQSDGLFKEIDDVVAALRAGSMSVKEVPINVIVREGHTLILNTRSAHALACAGIPRAEWNVINRTGDELFEGLLTRQLNRNKLDASGILNVVSKG